MFASLVRYVHGVAKLSKRKAVGINISIGNMRLINVRWLRLPVWAGTKYLGSVAAWKSHPGKRPPKFFNTVALRQKRSDLRPVIDRAFSNPNGGCQHRIDDDHSRRHSADGYRRYCDGDGGDHHDHHDHDHDADEGSQANIHGFMQKLAGKSQVFKTELDTTRTVPQQNSLQAVRRSPEPHDMGNSFYGLANVCNINNNNNNNIRPLYVTGETTHHSRR